MSTALKGRTHGRTDQRCKREKSSCQPGAVHTWPLADILRTERNVRFWGKADMKTYSALGKSGYRAPRCRAAGALLNMHSRGQLIRFVAQRFDEMAKRKKRIATVTRKLGFSINCRVQKPFLKDLDAYRKPLKLSRPAALVKPR